MDAKITATTYIDRAIDELLTHERRGDLHMILRNVLLEGVYLSLKSDLDIEQDITDHGDCAAYVEEKHARYAPDLTDAERHALVREFGLVFDEEF